MILYFLYLCFDYYEYIIIFEIDNKEYLYFLQNNFLKYIFKNIFFIYKYNNKLKNILKYDDK